MRMTVEELIQYLENVPDDYLVVIPTERGTTYTNGIFVLDHKEEVMICDYV